jgi:hypothetical protein
LLASPRLASWRQGVSLDIREWLTPRNGRTPTVIVSVAHLGDDERTLVRGVLVEEILAYTRSLPGSRRLKALVVFDEVYGLLPPRPPHPANPTTKRPTIAPMKQGRAFGVGVLVATQNPMDLDYRALSNAGFWAVGRLQTNADRERVVDSLANITESGSSAEEVSNLIRRRGPRAKRWRGLEDRRRDATGREWGSGRREAAGSGGGPRGLSRSGLLPCRGERAYRRAIRAGVSCWRVASGEAGGGGGEERGLGGRRTLITAAAARPIRDALTDQRG